VLRIHGKKALIVKPWPFTLLTFALCNLVCTPSYAHVSERALVLLLPTGYYTGFGIAAVVATLILTILLPPGFFRLLLTSEPPSARAVPDTGLRSNATSLLAFVGFTLLIILGLLGPRDPLENLLPLGIFTLWWICLPLAQVVFGDIWAWINPWSGPLWLVFRGRHAFTLPKRLGHWPALATYLMICTYALTDIAPEDPARLARAAGGYWIFTFVMGALFGTVWLQRGEGFSLFFGLFARITPFKLRRMRLQFPGKRITDGPALGISIAVFSVSLLAVGSFDGLHETFWWMGEIGVNPLAFPGRSAVTLPNQLGMLGAVAALNLAFATCVLTGLLLIGQGQDFFRVFCRVALTLLPIAAGYHLAHYLTSAMVNLQYVVKSLNDPLETGANLLGLRDFYVTTGFFNQHHIVEQIWLTQAISIVAAHMIAVVLSHAIALQEFGTHRAAVISQFPVALFMVLYTYFGLWLLASPVAL